MTKRTKEELAAIAALEQFAASAPVIAKPVKKKVEPEIVEAAPAPKKASKAKAAQSAKEAEAEVKATRPPNKVLQKFNSLGWMAKGMIILLILGVIAEIFKRL